MFRKCAITVIGIIINFNCGWANPPGKLSIINNFDTNVNVALGGNVKLLKNPENFPMNIASGDRAKLKLKLGKNNSDEQNTVFFSILSAGDPIHSSFFSAEIETDGDINIHGYISYPVAFSWTTGKNATVTLCTHDYYMQHNSCN